MTIAAEIPRLIVAGTSAGTFGPWDLAVDGTPWTYESETELVAFRYDMADAEARTQLAQGTDYDISGVSGAAQITLTAPQQPLLAEGRILIERITPIRQIFTTAGPRFDHIKNEEAHDRTVRILQEMRAKLERIATASGSGLEPDFLDEEDIANLTGLATQDGQIGFLAGACLELLDARGVLYNDGRGILSWREPLSGAGFREESDDTITMYGSTLLLGGASQTVMLPIGSSVTDYVVNATAEAGINIDPKPSNRTNSSFDLTPASATGIVFWKVTGARL